MLERYFVRPDTVDRIRVSWIGEAVERYVGWLSESELEQRIAALGRSGSWPEILADLDSLTETEIAHDRWRFLVRAAPRPAASLALRAAGVALPPTVQAIAAD